jgi:uncharacterized protein YkwD
MATIDETAPVETVTVALEPAQVRSRVFLPTILKAATTPAPSSIETQVVQLVNQERSRAGCPALTINSSLMSAAQGHSQDMATNNFMAHTGSNGSSPWDRIRAAGYIYSRAGENVAAGYASANAVMEGWMGSPGHRGNILNCEFREIGVGYATNTRSDYGTYWTQNFGTRR